MNTPHTIGTLEHLMHDPEPKMKPADTREKREWWAINDDDVLRVTGLSCAPGNPDYWWVPQLGFSMSVGVTLFDTEAKALDRCINNTRAGSLSCPKPCAR